MNTEDITKIVKRIPKQYNTSREVLQSIFWVAELTKEWGFHPVLMKQHFRLKRIYFNLRESENYEDAPTLAFSGRDSSPAV